MEIKGVNPSRPDSYERLCHDAGKPRFLLDLREGENEAARRGLMKARLERFIGVIYRRRLNAGAIIRHVACLSNSTPMFGPMKPRL